MEREKRGGSVDTRASSVETSRSTKRICILSNETGEGRMEEERGKQHKQHETNIDERVTANLKVLYFLENSRGDLIKREEKFSRKRLKQS